MEQRCKVGERERVFGKRVSRVTLLSSKCILSSKKASIYEAKLLIFAKINTF